MAFIVPEQYEGFYDESIRRFKLLLQKQVLNGIELNCLNLWLANFRTKEEQYLAAHLLNGLIYRSEHMLCSSYQHLIHSELPSFLQSKKFPMPHGLEHFLKELTTADNNYSLRFVAVDGAFEQTPGKSGSNIIRSFRRHLSINKQILCKPENINALPQSVRFLIFIDDMLGTGKQFSKFVMHYKLADLTSRFTMVYSPQISFETGLKYLNDNYPWLAVLPIEKLNTQNQFFREREGMQGVWYGDGVNKVADIKGYYDSLAQRAGIPKRSGYSLDLTVLFQHSAPNNTLSAYWAGSDHWKPLIPR